MKAELETLKLMMEHDKSLSPSELEIRNFLFKQEPKLRRIHDKMMSMLEKHYKETDEIREKTYLALLLTECTYIQSMLSRLYGLPTPAEDLMEELKNANL